MKPGIARLIDPAFQAVMPLAVSCEDQGVRVAHA